MLFYTIISSLSSLFMLIPLELLPCSEQDKELYGIDKDLEEMLTGIVLCDVICFIYLLKENKTFNVKLLDLMISFKQIVCILFLFKIFVFEYDTSIAQRIHFLEAFYTSYVLSSNEFLEQLQPEQELEVPLLDEKV